MAKLRCSFHLEKEDLEFIRHQAHKNHVSQAKFLHNCLDNYKVEQRLKIELPQRFAALFIKVYNTIMPLSFGSLATYFFFRRSWFFILFAFIAVLPLLLGITSKDRNIVMVDI